MSLAIKYEHILIDENGVAKIAGTTTKVVELIEEKLAFGWSPEEMHFQHSYLTMSQIHSALAYYWDNPAEIQQQINHRLQWDNMENGALGEKLRERARKLGLGGLTRLRR